MSKEFKWTDELVLMAIDLAHHNGYHKLKQKVTELFDEIKNQAQGNGYRFASWIADHLKPKPDPHQIDIQNAIAMLVADGYGITPLGPQAKKDKDWEIVAYKTKYFGQDDVIIHKDVGGIWRPVKGYISLFALSNDEELKKVGTIYKVRRLSDGECFSVGDEVCRETDANKIGSAIVSFIQVGDNMNVKTKQFATFLHLLQKSKPEKERIVLFTTEDGVDVYDGDTFYRLQEWKVFETKASWSCVGARYTFSTREKAEQYIKENKPLNLSMKEIASCVTNYVYQGGSSRSVYERRRTEIDFEKLEALINSKLK